ncbi:hypothetical protein J2S70_001379 [Trueperella bonasi]|uniref:Uncharacterized protein n=1 Tax=Trueperella bonasi TaxID=312286 RepID=A0ABT9NHD9_9ACTO|nr:hypothetical protein [Trueperella bonasi]
MRLSVRLRLRRRSTASAWRHHTTCAWHNPSQVEIISSAMTRLELYLEYWYYFSPRLNIGFCPKR